MCAMYVSLYSGKRKEQIQTTRNENQNTDKRNAFVPHFHLLSSFKLILSFHEFNTEKDFFGTIGVI